MISLNPLDELQVGQDFILFTLQSFKNLFDKFILLGWGHQINWLGYFNKEWIAARLTLWIHPHIPNIYLTTDK
jgi:hypothetical protein